MVTIKGGRYRVVGTLASSAEALVYLADDTTSSRQVALTVLRGDAATDAEFVTAVRDQAHRLAKLTGLATPAVYECDVTDEGDLFVILEPLTGRSLRDVLDARGPLDPTSALRLAIQIGEALETLHRNGIVHGALRPESVLVVTDEHGAEAVKLLGVELATARGTPVGIQLRDEAVAYLAPEQLERGDLSEAADIHALGLLIQEFLTAQRPLASGPRLRPAGELPPLLASIVARALESRPERRYSSVSLLVNDLWTAESEPLKVESPSVKHVLNERRATARRRARSDLGMAVALVVGLLLVGVTAWVVRSERLTGSVRTEPTEAALPAALPPAPTPASTLGIQPSRPPALPAATDPASPVSPGSVAPSPVPIAKTPPASPPPARIDQAPPAAREPTLRDREPAAPVPARSEPRASDGADGTAIIDWVLRNQRRN
jgi:serine/threonine protein kinase